MTGRQEIDYRLQITVDYRLLTRLKGVIHVLMSSCLKKKQNLWYLFFVRLSET